MKNAARKSIGTHYDKFVQLVRAHHKVKCHSSQQHAHDVSRNEREFRKNPWEHAQKMLAPAKITAEPSFSVSTAVEHFTQTYSNHSTQYCQLPSWITEALPNCTTSLFNETPVLLLLH